MDHVLIVSATTDEKVTADVALMFGRAHQKNAEGRPPKFSTLVLKNLRGHAYMRNAAVKCLLDSPCDALWFVDGDALPGPDIFDLLAVPGDIVAAAMPYETQKGSCLILSDPDDLDSVAEAPNVPVFDCQAVGTGCTIIQRAVLEDERMRLPDIYERPDGVLLSRKDEPTAVPAVFRYLWKPDGFTNMGEDWDFTYRASKLGYRVRFVRDVEVGHLKPLDLRLVSARDLVPA